MNFIRTSYQPLRNKLSHVHLHLHTSLSIPCCMALFISIGLSILLINFLKCSFCSFNVHSPIAECSVLPVMQDSLRIEYQSSDLCFMYSGYFFRKLSSCRVSGLLKIHEFNIVSNRIGPLFRRKNLFITIKCSHDSTPFNIYFKEILYCNVCSMNKTVDIRKSHIISTTNIWFCSNLFLKSGS